MTLRGTDGPLLDGHDLLVLDLDGVVYVGQDAVPHAVTALRDASAAGVRLAYVTNNASRTPAEVSAHLVELGLPAGPGDVVTSSQAAARIVVDELGAATRVLAIGGPGVPEALREAGLEPVPSADDRPDAVVQGFGPDVGWRDLTEAAFAVRAGALWVATNADATLPTARGPAPGNGSLVAAVRTATGHEPRVAGKPEPALFRLAAEGAAAPLAVGDRLDTDVAAGRRAGMPTLLVLTGVTSWPALLAAEPPERPDHVAQDLRGLRHTQHAPAPDGTGWRCGGARAAVVDGVLTVDPPGPDGDGFDVVRAATAAAWAAADQGLDCEPDPAARRWLDAAVGAGR